MSILKAFLLTVLLIVMVFLLTIPFYYYLFVLDTFAEANPHIEGSFEIVPKLIAYAVIILAVVRFDLKLNIGLEKIKSLRLDIIIYIFLIAFGLRLVIKPLYEFETLISIFNGNEINPNSYSQIISIPFYYGAFSTMIISPICEELFFRKVLISKLLTRNSLNISILVSSLCFMLIHFANFNNLIPTLLLGIACALVYVKSKNIFYPILLHFFYNLDWMVLTIFREEYVTWLRGINYGPIYWIVVGIGILLVILGFRFFRQAV